MIIQAKKNGKPRRTIDLSALTKASVRDTHHTRNPAKVARTTPADKLKSTLDCIDGYHGVEIAEEDRLKTTFITEEGKFQYKRIPQGYSSSGDEYIQGGQTIYWLPTQTLLTYRTMRRLLLM